MTALVPPRSLYRSILKWGSVIGLSILAGAMLHATFFTGTAPLISDALRIKTTTSTSLTNPLLECAELPKNLTGGERLILQNEITQFFNQKKSEGVLTEAAVYYRDLNNGPWFGFEEERKYNPGSLLKLPLATSFYLRAEHEPDLMKRQIEYQKGKNNLETPQPFSTFTGLENKVYTIEELIKIMLTESSNEAALALAQIAGPEQIASIYNDFGIEAPSSGVDYGVDARTYSSFFRILYNATYLDRLASEVILEMLIESKFKNGLVAGVPAGVKVAHKFGSREVAGEASRQLHDCGIIYAPGRPYILCVMTHGNDFEDLADVIRAVSAMVYKSVS